MEVYVVMGSTGEYSDRTEWPIHAYLNKQQAEDHVTKAEEWALAAGLKDTNERGYSLITWDGIENPYDPHMYCSYTGVYYWYMTVPMGEFIPKFNEK